MLEKIPPVIGHALAGVRAGDDKLVWSDPSADGPETITLISSAFEDRASLPAAFTEDGEAGSPPLAWRNAPLAAAALLLVIEDADSPTPQPIIHTLAAGPAATQGALEAGALAPGGATDWLLGKNSFGKLGYLPPDPPTGHGAHCYVVQLYALRTAPNLEEGFGKSDMLEALRGNVLARGAISTLYERPG